MKSTFTRHLSPVFGMAILTAAFGCGGGGGDIGEGNLGSSWEALLADGDASAIVPDGSAAPQAVSQRYCDDCTRVPLAYWRLDDCNAQSTELADTAGTSSVTHPAFRAVSTACVGGVVGSAAKLAGQDDIVYSPDQPDYIFDSGLTVAAWIKPDNLSGTQTIFRKRFTGSSSFVLALEGKKVSFALRLSNGRAIGISAPVKAGRFTHVAATYDGKQAVLYVDGVAVAQAKAAGKIAAGSGPIMIGNDADGRRFSGTVDQIWLNTLAAPADQVMLLTCIPNPLVVSISPSDGPVVDAGTNVAFDLSITNQDSASCGVQQLGWYSGIYYPLIYDASNYSPLSIAPGATGHATVNIRSDELAPIGAYPFTLYVWGQESAVDAQATYNVGNTCVRQPPLVSISPKETLPQVAGSTVPFDLSLTNQNSALCKTNDFFMSAYALGPLTLDSSGNTVTVAPGETLHSTINVTSPWTTPVGSYWVYYNAYDLSQYAYVSDQATYIVGTASQQAPDALAAPGGQVTVGPYSGYAWAVADSDGSTITLNPNYLCASGTAIQVPIGPDGTPDYGGAWGTLLGLNLNQPTIDGNALPADFSGKTQMTIALSGATGLTMRAQFQVTDASGTAHYYCASIPQDGTTLPLTSFMEQCWSNSGATFDPTTMKPDNFGIAVVTSPYQAYPYNYCVTGLSID